MKKIEYRTNKCDEYIDGPWKNEPDKIQWQDEETGYPCLIVRNNFGGLCGYVGLAPDHPLHGVDYDYIDVDVHGGLTYASHCQKKAPEDSAICHIPDEGETDNVWWLGFDCVHVGDLDPATATRFPEREGWETYRNIDYVKRGVKSLAQQLKEKEEEKG